MKIGVVGFGAASIGFISEILDEDHEIHVLERSKDIFSSSISGIRSDGKIFVSPLEQVIRIRTGETGEEAI